MALNPSPHRQSVVTFPTPNVNDILFFETVDAERVGTDVPEYGSSHPDFNKWPDHRLVHIEAADDQSRYYRYYYAADQIDQDDDNWAYSKADIGGTKFDAVTRDYVIRRSEFDPDTPAMGAVMSDVPEDKFSGTYVLAERKQIPINDKILNGLYVIEQRTYLKKVPLTRFDFDEFFMTTNETKQILYYRSEVPNGASSAIENLDSDNAYWGIDSSGVVRTVQQLSDNWYAVTEQEVVKCPEGEVTSGLDDLQTVARQSIVDATNGKTTSDLNLFSTYTGATSLVRNANCWAHNLRGVTGFVAWNDKTGIEKKVGGVAITPRHILYAGHAAYSPNDIVYFVSKNNEIYARTIVKVKNHTSYANASTWDFGIARLDLDLPAAIDIVKVLPKDAYQYFQTDDFNDTELVDPDVTAGYVLAMTTDQDENAHVRRISSLDFGSFDYNNPDSGYHEYELVQDSGDYSDWSEPVVAGDSGSVATLVIDGECVLLGVMSKQLNSYTVQGAFVGAPKIYKEINDLIADVDASYSSTPLNYTTTSKSLAFSYRSYRTEEGVAEVYPNGLCASLEYETVVSYNFPPILERVELDVWEERSGGARTYPRVLYSKGAYSGPCKAKVFIGWATTPPPAVVAENKPIPEPISIQTPIFSLQIPPTLHEAVSFNVSVGTNDETYEPTNAAFSKGATNVTSWEPHIVSSEVKPFRGGWLIETVLVYPPS